MSKEEISVCIRWMIRRDMPEILAIENKNFEYSWLEKDFIRCLRQRNCAGLVAEYEDEIVGYVVYKRRRNSIGILSFATAEWAQRQGVASQMMASIMDKLTSLCCNRLVLEVRESNLDAQLFLRENGFAAISTLKDFYEETSEDAYVMEFHHRETFMPINRMNFYFNKIVPK